MSKKNTLLYLDKKLVEVAKDAGLNLSKLTESAIKTELFPRLSGGERALLFPEDHLENLKDQKRCFEAPFRIDRVEIRNIGPLSDFEAELDDFNVITGHCGTGKTTALRSIAYACNLENWEAKDLLKQGEKEGEIKVEPLQAEGLSVKLRRGEKKIEEKTSQGALLLDNPIARFPLEGQKRYLDFLKEKNVQIIMTTLPQDIQNGFEDSGINVINIGEGGSPTIHENE